MRLVRLTAVLMLSAAPLVLAQSGAPRAWQQRLDVDIALPVPIIGLTSANPFAIAVDQPPRLLSSEPPRKLDVDGVALVAAYVDAKGDCLGGVPLELPFPGLTTALLEEITSVRFDPARTADSTVGSWVVLGLQFEGRVKESAVGSPSFELPNPSSPPVPASPQRVVPSGLLLRAPYTPQDQLASFASPRRLKVKAPSQEVEIPVRAMVHITAGGRCDRFVPLTLETGLHPWLSAYLATWRLEPAQRDGEAHDAWVVWSARAQLKMSSLDSNGVTVIRSRSYAPSADES